MKSRPRIVSLCPSNTELVHALELLDCLVGVDNYSDYPSEVTRQLPKLGPDLNIDMEMVSALKPDLVLASLSVPGMEKVVDAVAASGLPYLVLSPHNLSEIYQDLTSVSDWLEDPVQRRRTERLIQSLKDRVERVQSTTQSLAERPTLYWEWWPSPVFSPAKENWLTEISHLAGAVNLFASEPGSQVQDDGHRVISGNPDYFFAVWTGVPQDKVPIHKLIHRPGWDKITALAKNQVYILSEGLYCRPSPRLIDGLEQLTSLIHPEMASVLALRKLTDYAPVRDITGANLLL